MEKINIIDALLERMEQHTQNLETSVEEKTRALTEEKKKTDQLLYSILPRWAFKICSCLKMIRRRSSISGSEILVFLTPSPS